MLVEEVVMFSADAGDESDVETGAGRGRDVSLRMRAVTSSWNEDDARKALCASKVSRTVIYEFISSAWPFSSISSGYLKLIKDLSRKKTKRETCPDSTERSRGQHTYQHGPALSRAPRAAGPSTACETLVHPGAGLADRPRAFQRVCQRLRGCVPGRRQCRVSA